MIATTAANVLREIAEHGDAPARLDRWLAETGLPLDTAFHRLLDCAPPPAKVRNAVVHWYLRRASAASPTAAALDVAALELGMNISSATARQILAHSFAAAYLAEGLAPPLQLALLEAGPDLLRERELRWTTARFHHDIRAPRGEPNP